MIYQTHQIFNIAVVTGLCAIGTALSIDLPISDTAVFALGSIAGATLPDIDNPHSKIRFQILKYTTPKKERWSEIQKALNAPFDPTHRRNFTHWPFFWLLVCTVLFLLLLRTPFSLLAVGIFVGALGHLFCDLCTFYGIMLLAPFSKKQFHLNLAQEIYFIYVSLYMSFVFILIIFGIRFGILSAVLKELLMIISIFLNSLKDIF